MSSSETRTSDEIKVWPTVIAVLILLPYILAVLVKDAFKPQTTE